MGCSPYFAITGAHPILPFDIAQATYLQLPPTSVMSSTDLISHRAIALQKHSANVNTLYSKVYQAQLKAACWFEQQHLRTLKDFNFQRGSLVLMCNTLIEKSLNKKMHTRYIGPLLLVSCNYGSAYILSELDGTALHCPIATFCLLPYFPRKSIPLPPDIINIDNTPSRNGTQFGCRWRQRRFLPKPHRQSHQIQHSYLSLFIFPLPFYHIPLSEISPFIPRTRYGLIIYHARLLLHGSQGYDVKLSLTFLLFFIFSLLYYKDKDILEKASKR
jgi:hypothetical protein